MKKISLKAIALLFVLSISTVLFSQTNNSHIPVKGYVKSDGTIVQPYKRTAPNSTNMDNFSTLGNSNPYTGKEGTVTPDYKNLPASPSYNNNLVSNPYSVTTSTDLAVWELQEKWRIENKMEESRKEMAALIAKIESEKPKPTNDLDNVINFYSCYLQSERLFIENSLNKLGYNVGIIDGYIDNFTIDAVKKFQRDNGLTCDGKAGQITVSMIMWKL